MKYAIVEGGVVTNVIEWDGVSGEKDNRKHVEGQELPAWVPFSVAVAGKNKMLAVPKGLGVGVGWTVKKGEFVPLVQTPSDK